MPSRHSIRTIALVFLCLYIGFGSFATAAPGSFQWSTLDQTLGSLSTSSNLLVAEVRGSTCQTIHGRNQDQRLAIASTQDLCAR